MTNPVTLPLWLFIGLIIFAAWAALERVLIPSVRWVLRRRINRVIDEVNTRLNIGVRSFQLTKRQVLIDRLAYDPKVLEAMQAYAAENNMPREVAQAEVLKYAREIVPAFNAYIYFRVGYWLAERLARLMYRCASGSPTTSASPRSIPRPRWCS
jgi:glycerol-3-phosphate O-acyltransferase